MKPRTKYERNVLAMSARLPRLTDRQKAYGFGLFKPTGFYTTSELWCSNCGHVHYADYKSLSRTVVGIETCEQCGEELTMEKSRKTMQSDGKYVDFITTYKGWQVVRTFAFTLDSKKGKESKRGVHEVWQKWYDENGRETICGIDYWRSIYAFVWKYGTPMAIRHHNGHAGGYFCFDDVFNNRGHYVYPTTRTTARLRRNGWSGKLLGLGVDLADLIKRLLGGTDAEWLVKIGYTDVLVWLMSRGGYNVPYKYCVKIAARNGYRIEDVSTWYDYLDNLSRIGKDLRNAKYVCPPDLQKAHDWCVRKVEERQERERLEAQKKRIAEGEKMYKASRGMFLGVQFDNGRVFVHVLQDVKEFYAEGKVMCHCVFENEYWNKDRHPDSLIMSATDKEGNRLETVEVNTKTWKVVQSRGQYNKNTAQHGDIVALVDKYIPLIRKTAYTGNPEKITTL